VALDPLGGVSAVIDSVPQGQGHRTVAAQVVGEVFGLPAAAIRVNTELDTGKDAGRLPPAIIRAGSPVPSPVRRTSRRCGCVTSSPASPLPSSTSSPTR
jgi:hypothetical protein